MTACLLLTLSTMTNRHGRSRNRRTVRLSQYDYRNPGAYFVTICTHAGELSLATVVNGAICLSLPGETVRVIVERLPLRFPTVQMDAFIIMPNHLHGIVLLRSAGDSQSTTRIPVSLGQVVRAIKAASTRQIRATGHREFAWQRNYYERIIRDEGELARIRQYIRNNPLRWESDPEYPRTSHPLIGR